MEKVLMKGNEALAEAALRAGCRFYSGYPITPQTEILEYLSWRMAEVGGQFIQTESELGGVNMLYGAAATGARAMTSSSGPGFALQHEGISYLCAADLPAVLIDVMRIGNGLGDIAQGQGDYWAVTRGGGNGDYRTIVLAPNSVQEGMDLVRDAFDLAEKYLHPVIIASDAAIGQMMEKVVLAPQRPRKTNEEIAEECKEWAACGKGNRKERNIITSLELQSEVMEKINQRLQAKYKALEENEVRYEAINCDDADYVIVAFGSSARICSATVELARAEGLKVGLLRPITLYPFPSKVIADLAKRGVKGFLSAELNAGQMVEDVRLAVNGAAPVEHYGRQGGMLFAPDEVLVALKEKLINKK